MRVICIEDVAVEKTCPKIIKGNLYTVIDKRVINGWQKDGYSAVNGLYYELVEIGSCAVYHHSAFLEVNENQQDETEMQRNYDKIKQTV